MHNLCIELLGKQNTAMDKLSNKRMFSFIQRICSYTLWITNHTVLWTNLWLKYCPSHFLYSPYVRSCTLVCMFCFGTIICWCKCLHFHNVSLYWQQLDCFFLEVAYRLFELLLISVWIKKVYTFNLNAKTVLIILYVIFISPHYSTENYCFITFYKNVITFYASEMTLFNEFRPPRQGTNSVIASFSWCNQIPWI